MFSLFEQQKVELVIYNTLGENVKSLFSGILDKWEHIITFDGKDLPSGIYYYTLYTELFEETRKMLFLK